MFLQFTISKIKQFKLAGGSVVLIQIIRHNYTHAFLMDQPFLTILIMIDSDQPPQSSEAYNYSM